jgi:hypothetical protein
MKWNYADLFAVPSSLPFQFVTIVFFVAHWSEIMEISILIKTQQRERERTNKYQENEGSY